MAEGVGGALELRERKRNHWHTSSPTDLLDRIEADNLDVVRSIASRYEDSVAFRA